MNIAFQYRACSGDNKGSKSVKKYISIIDNYEGNIFFQNNVIFSDSG